MAQGALGPAQMRPRRAPAGRNEVAVLRTEVYGSVDCFYKRILQPTCYVFPFDQILLKNGERSVAKALSLAAEAYILPLPLEHYAPGGPRSLKPQVPHPRSWVSNKATSQDGGPLNGVTQGVWGHRKCSINNCYTRVKRLQTDVCA